MKMAKHMIYVAGLLFAVIPMMVYIPLFIVLTPVFAFIQTSITGQEFNWMAGVEQLYLFTDPYFEFIERYKQY